MTRKCHAILHNTTIPLHSPSNSPPPPRTTIKLPSNTLPKTASPAPPPPYTSSFLSTTSLAPAPTYTPATHIDSLDSNGALSSLYTSRKSSIYALHASLSTNLASLNAKLADLAARKASITLAFQPAIAECSTAADRLHTEIDRRQLLTETLISQKITSLTMPLNSHITLLKTAQLALESNLELTTAVLGREPTELIHAYPRIQLESKQVANSYEYVVGKGMPAQVTVSADMYPKSYLEGCQVTSEKTGRRPPARGCSDEKDAIIGQLVDAVEKLELLADVKKSIGEYSRQQSSLVKASRQAITRSKQRTMVASATALSATVAPTLALEGTQSARRNRTADELQSYMRPTMANYAKSKMLE